MYAPDENELCTGCHAPLDIEETELCFTCTLPDDFELPDM